MLFMLISKRLWGDESLENILCLSLEQPSSISRLIGDYVLLFIREEGEPSVNSLSSSTLYSLHGVEWSLYEYREKGSRYRQRYNRHT